MVNQSKNNSQKKEMPENIRKMFEQKHVQNNNDVNLKSNQQDLSNHISDDKEITFKTQEHDILKSEKNEHQKDKALKSRNKTKKPNSIEQKDENELLQNTNTDELKSKNKKLSKKQKIGILSALLAVVCVAFVITLVIFLTPKTIKLPEPVVKVYSLSNQTIVYVDENEDAKSYEFYIQKKGETETCIPSQNNEISIKNKLSSPGEYYIWARYRGKNDKETSNISVKYTYKYYETLDVPNVNMAANNQNLTWVSIYNAKEYRVYYVVDGEQMNYITVQQPANINSNVVFDLSSIGQGHAGRYSVCVQAVADENTYYYSSELSQSFLYLNKIKLQDVLNANFNLSNNVLDFAIDTEKTTTNYFEIIINDTDVYQYKSNEILENYSLDLTPYIKQGLVVTNVKVKAIGDGDCLLDSNYFNATINA